MSTINKAEQKLYQSTYAMKIPDVQNELELYDLPTTGTKTAYCQRISIYNEKQQYLPKREYRLWCRR